MPYVRVLQRRTASARRGLMIRIALDAMGSDNAPQVEVEGAAQALKELPAEFQIQLVGRKADIEAALARLPGGADRTRIEIVDAPEEIGRASCRERGWAWEAATERERAGRPSWTGCRL